MKKNILIISNPFDSSTEDVMDWINFYGYIVQRINAKNILSKATKLEQELSNEIVNFKLLGLGQSIILENLYSIWYRKSSKIDIEEYLRELEDEDLYMSVEEHLMRESSRARDSILSIGKVKKSLGEEIIKPPSKIEMLISARENNIQIPDTLITNEKSSLERFLKKHKKIVTKPLSEINGFEKNNVEAALYTELIDESNLRDIPDSFFPSLFQEAINKEFEIRTFYLNGKCFSSAIFSQLDNQTNIDFRMYNLEKANRCIPYKLDKNTEIKLCNLMGDLKLNTGSIDLIKTKDNKIVFLEVNPWGQYGYMSRRCNYQIDKLIAEYLIK